MYGYSSGCMVIHAPSLLSLPPSLVRAVLGYGRPFPSVRGGPRGEHVFVGRLAHFWVFSVLGLTRGDLPCRVRGAKG